MTSDLDHLIAQCEADVSLFEPHQLQKRIEALDALDAYIGDLVAETAFAATDCTELFDRAKSLCAKLETANAAIYQSIRHQIQKSDPPSQLLHWIDECGGNEQTPRPGLAFDVLDELISGVLQAREPHLEPDPLQPDMVFYQPTPARHILQFIRLSALTESDTLIDLGSGLGHVPILASILTGAQCIGIEAEQTYVASARECAASLRLNRVTFLHQNAIEANLTAGTAFFLYTPFTGTTLKAVLQKLRNTSNSRTIAICTLGPCTLTIATEPWLNSTANPDPEQITIFRASKLWVPHP